MAPAFDEVFFFVVVVVGEESEVDRVVVLHAVNLRWWAAARRSSVPECVSLLPIEDEVAQNFFSMGGGRNLRRVNKQEQLASLFDELRIDSSHDSPTQ